MTLSELFDALITEQYFDVSPTEVSYRLRRVGRCTLHILFEWSRGVEDWLSNLDLLPTSALLSDTSVKVHRGFYRAYRSVRERLLSALSDRALERLIIGGYSHGAALAALTLADTHTLCRERGIEAVGIGFGAPRVLWGVSREADALMHRFFVVRCGSDLVTHLPPAALGFRHGGRLLSLAEPVRHTPWDAHRAEAYRAALAHTPLGAREVFSLVTENKNTKSG